MLPAVVGLVKGKMKRAGQPSSRIRVLFGRARDRATYERNASKATAILRSGSDRVKAKTHAISGLCAVDDACPSVTLTGEAEPVL
jgi:hypothetical protein